MDLEAEASAVIPFTCKGRSVGIYIWSMISGGEHVGCTAGATHEELYWSRLRNSDETRVPAEERDIEQCPDTTCPVLIQTGCRERSTDCWKDSCLPERR